jgi:hypothetical protein
MDFLLVPRFSPPGSLMSRVTRHQSLSALRGYSGTTIVVMTTA